jgi:aryl-alcohol dehydrogenase-like predicted oxidoreductase
MDIPTRTLGRTGMHVTEVSLGGVAFGGLHGPVPEAEAATAPARAIDLGVNFIDTSPLYVDSEARLGRHFGAQGGWPAGTYLSTKTGTHPSRRGDYSADGTRWSVGNSLHLLGVTSVDCLLVHDPRDDAEMDAVLAPGGALDTLEELEGDGALRSIGLGCRPHRFHRRAIDSDRFDLMLTFGDYNLMRQTASPLIEAAHDSGMGVIAAWSIGSGLLAGPDPRTVARLANHPDLEAAIDWWEWARDRQIDLRAVAIQWVLRNPKVGCTLVGARNGDELAENLASSRTPIADEIWTEVEARIHEGRGHSRAAGGEAQ